MIIQLEFAGLTQLREVPEDVERELEMHWIRETSPFSINPLEELPTSTLVTTAVLTFTYTRRSTQEGYPIYSLNKIDKY